MGPLFPTGRRPDLRQLSEIQSEKETAMDMKPIIVMAGTPVDTQMGMDCLSTQGLPGVFCPISEDPNQQTAFQISSTEEKLSLIHI